MDPPQRGNMGEVPGGRGTFWCAEVCRTRRRAKKILRKKRREKEPGEERDGDDDRDGTPRTETGTGMGMGETKVMGQGQVRVHRGLTGMRVWGWWSPGWRVKGWWMTGRFGVSSGARRAPPTTQEE